ncbi:hypothetical protein BC834DRAFT_412036 [Gloeopeniophorella convolvens]|nr:hypothetical protein BC834DRAFT_412036 [Gloeopeniophorella convolvens]
MSPYRLLTKRALICADEGATSLACGRTFRRRTSWTRVRTRACRYGMVRTTQTPCQRGRSPRCSLRMVLDSLEAACGSSVNQIFCHLQLSRPLTAAYGLRLINPRSTQFGYRTPGAASAIPAIAPYLISQCVALTEHIPSLDHAAVTSPVPSQLSPPCETRSLQGPPSLPGKAEPAPLTAHCYQPGTRL